MEDLTQATPLLSSPRLNSGHPMVLPEAGTGPSRVLSREGWTSKGGKQRVKQPTILSTAGFHTAFKMLMGFYERGREWGRIGNISSNPQNTQTSLVSSPHSHPSLPQPLPHPCIPTSTRWLQDTQFGKRFVSCPLILSGVTRSQPLQTLLQLRWGTAAGGRWATGSECRK